MSYVTALQIRKGNSVLFSWLLNGMRHMKSPKVKDKLEDFLSKLHF